MLVLWSNITMYLQSKYKTIFQGSFNNSHKYYYNKHCSYVRLWVIDETCTIIKREVLSEDLSCPFYVKSGNISTKVMNKLQVLELCLSRYTFSLSAKKVSRKAEVSARLQIDLYILRFPAKMFHTLSVWHQGSTC